MIRSVRAVLATGVAAVVLLASSGAGAQTSAPDSAKLALAKRYFEAIHMGQVMTQTFAALGPALSSQMVSQYDGQLTPSQMTALTQATSETMTDMVKDMMPKMEQVMVPVVAEVFSTDELNGLVSFYESPLGQSLIAKTPQMSQAMAAHLPELQPDQQAITAELLQKFCAKTDCNSLPKPKTTRSKL